MDCLAARACRFGRLPSMYQMTVIKGLKRWQEIFSHFDKQINQSILAEYLKQNITEIWSRTTETISLIVNQSFLKVDKNMLWDSTTITYSGISILSNYFCEILLSISILIQYHQPNPYVRGGVVEFYPFLFKRV